MEKLPIPIPERESYLKHKKEFTRHIILPLVIANVLILAVAVLVGVATFGWGGDVSRWAAISIIWMAIPTMIMMLLVLVLMAALVYGLGYLLKKAPRYTGISQNWLLWLNYKIQYYTDMVIEPVIQLRAWMGILTKEKKK